MWTWKTGLISSRARGPPWRKGLATGPPAAHFLANLPSGPQIAPCCLNIPCFAIAIQLYCVILGFVMRNEKGNKQGSKDMSLTPVIINSISIAILAVAIILLTFRRRE